MIVNNHIATEKMRANHEMRGCVCGHTTTQILNIAGDRNIRANVPLIVIKEKDRLGYSLVVHGDEWLTEFMASLQLNGVSVRNREDIKRTIKNEATFIIQQAVAVMGLNDGEMAPMGKVAENKVNALMAHCDEIKERLIAQGEDEEAVEKAIQAVLSRKFAGIINGNG